MVLHKSLRALHNPLASAAVQLEILNDTSQLHEPMAPFGQKLQEVGLYPLRPVSMETLQINLGKMCNQVCRHCHVDAGPDRREIMSRPIMEACLAALESHDFQCVDLTGGAPEMNPDFRWFIGEIRRVKPGVRVIVRCNLTIILANKKYRDLPLFFRENDVEVVSSLPFYNASRTDAQRGDGVFEASIQALQLLNEAGYGQEGSGLLLNLVYNPAGAFLPAAQEGLEREFKRALLKNHGITFNNLFCITNLPVSRYLEYLLDTGNYANYMEKLITAFNPQAASGVMCRSMISVGWDGRLYDCDFNQMLELTVQTDAPTIQQFDRHTLLNRTICTNQHCFGCTAGAGSSCGGEVV